VLLSSIGVFVWTKTGYEDWDKTSIMFLPARRYPKDYRECKQWSEAGNANYDFNELDCHLRSSRKIHPLLLHCPKNGKIERSVMQMPKTQRCIGITCPYECSITYLNSNFTLKSENSSCKVDYECLSGICESVSYNSNTHNDIRLCKRIDCSEGEKALGYDNVYYCDKSGKWQIKNPLPHGY